MMLVMPQATGFTATHKKRGFTVVRLKDDEMMMISKVKLLLPKT